jgi:hypothetical protein
MGDLNDGPYNKSVKIALAKANKRMYSHSGFTILLRNGQGFRDYSISRFLGYL